MTVDPFEHSQDRKMILHSSGRCLDLLRKSDGGGEIFLTHCTGSDTQKWEFEFYLEPNPQSSEKGVELPGPLWSTFILSIQSFFFESSPIAGPTSFSVINKDAPRSCKQRNI